MSVEGVDRWREERLTALDKCCAGDEWPQWGEKRTFLSRFSLRCKNARYTSMKYLLLSNSVCNFWLELISCSNSGIPL